MRLKKNNLINSLNWLTKPVADNKIALSEPKDS